MKTNNEMTIDLTKMVACVGVEACDGVINELDGISESTLEFFKGTDEDGFDDEESDELIGVELDDVGSVVSYEEGCKEVISYFEDHCLNEDEEESVNELEELKDLLVKLKEKTEGKNVKWILWGIETDIALGFIE